MRPRPLTIAAWLLLAALIPAALFFPVEQREEAARETVVRIWNVDTFEGGKESRTAFLRRAAALAEQKQKGVLYNVTSYTEEGVREAFARGETPDILSFGIGMGDVFSLLADTKGTEPVPWCCGAYYLFSLTDDLPERGAPDGSVALSAGGANFPEASAYFAGIEGEKVQSLSAYLGFLSGEYDFLLGTQRDVCRFQSRGVTVYSRLLPAYCDLMQYVAVLRTEHSACSGFVGTLLSEEVQAELYTIGMYPAKSAQGRTAPPLCSGEELRRNVQKLCAGNAERELDALFPAVRSGAK